MIMLFSASIAIGSVPPFSFSSNLVQQYDDLFALFLVVDLWSYTTIASKAFWMWLISEK